jgi:lipopolysaccharide biosynthesis regulator YciM
MDVPLIALGLGASLSGLARLLGIGPGRDRSGAPWRADDGPEAIHRYGLDAEVAGRSADAVAAYHEVIRREPAHAGAHARLAELAQRRGDRQAAMLHALQALRADDHPERVLAAADAYTQAGRPDDAIALYRDLLGRDPDHVTALRRLRDAALTRGRWAEALRAQERLTKVAPASERSEEEARLAAVHYEIGAAKLAASDPAGAMAAFRDALRAQADFVPAVVALGDAHVAAGDPSHAVRVWERGIEAQPALPILVRLEHSYRAEGRPRRMIALYERAVARLPDDLALAVALGRVYFELSMLDEAAEQFEKVEVRAPDLPSIHAFLGAIFERRGQAREAFEEYRRALGAAGSFEWPYRCTACGASRAGWADRCPSCRRLNTLRP